MDRMERTNRSRNYKKENAKRPEWVRKFYNSTRWHNVRDYVMARDARLCQDCRKNGTVTPATEVHHIKPVTADNVGDDRITVNPDNLVSLCHRCHEKRHNERRYKLDEYGRVSLM